LPQNARIVINLKPKNLTLQQDIFEINFLLSRILFKPKKSAAKAGFFS
jgi:hypothetical protein